LIRLAWTCSALVLIATPAIAAELWSPVQYTVPPSPGEIPGARVVPSAIYDAAHHRIVIYGGQKFDVLRDFSALSLDGSPSWSPIIADAGGGTVPPRRDHLAVYDSQQQRMIVFGGSPNAGINNEVNDVWSLSLDAANTWSNVPVSNAGAGPSPRLAMGGVYDPVLDRLVIYGGSSMTSTFFDETWALTLGATPTWAALATAGDPPPARNAMSLVYDSIGDRLIVFGGWSGHDYLGDVWALPLGAPALWQSIEPVGSVRPGPRRAAAAAFDPVRNRLIISGGFNGLYLGDTWALDLSGTPTWSQIGMGSPTGPGGRFGHRAVYDPEGDRLVEFGGYGQGDPEIFTADWFNDTWALPLGPGGVWEQLAKPSIDTAPPTLRNHVAVFDPAGDRMVVFGGDSPEGLMKNAWALPFGDFPAWSRIPAGSGPTARQGHAGALDTQRRRILIFGGHDVDYYLNDLWALSLTDPPAWTKLSPASTNDPEPRGAAAAVYDPVGDRLLVFGGFGRFTGTKGDLWSFPLGVSNPQWVELSPSGTGPSPRRNCVALYDADRRRVIIHGGVGSDDLNDAWALDLTAPGDGRWVSLDTGTPYSPPARHGHSAILDLSGRFILFGGQTLAQVHDDTWTSGPASFAFWTPIPADPPAQRPAARDYCSLVFDPVRNRAILFGGQDESGVDLDDPWYLQLDAETVDVFPGPVLALALTRPAPNPARAAFGVTISLPHKGGASIGLFDVRGRMVVTRDLSALPPGEQRIKLIVPAGTNSGVYFVALTQDGVVRRTKIAILE
jgi:hypothetical protein